MKRKTPVNVSASVRARLLKVSKERREDFTLTLMNYAAERFLYRLSRSTYREQFVLTSASAMRSRRPRRIWSFRHSLVSGCTRLIRRCQRTRAEYRDSSHGAPERTRAESASGARATAAGHTLIVRPPHPVSPSQ